MFDVSAWLRRRRAARVDAPRPFFDAVLYRVPALARLDPAARDRLYQLAREFLADKEIVGVQGFEVDVGLAIKIATLCCWPILELGYRALDGWRQVVVYPDSFRAHRHERDEATGVVHEYEQDLAGEAWLHGPMLISAQDLELDLAHPEDVQNVVIHELAHKLDGLDGAMDGMPPLPRSMSRQRWIQVFQRAYDELRAEVDRGVEPLLDPYAATEPEEFFAVTTEYYFLAPELLRHRFPDVHEQLERFYQHRP